MTARLNHSCQPGQSDEKEANVLKKNGWFCYSQPTQMAKFQKAKHSRDPSRQQDRQKTVDRNNPNLENAEQAKPRKAIQDFK
jgi:hypothetical protein